MKTYLHKCTDKTSYSLPSNYSIVLGHVGGVSGTGWVGTSTGCIGGWISGTGWGGGYQTLRGIRYGGGQLLGGYWVLRISGTEWVSIRY